MKSRVRITAEVEEAGRGTKQSDTISFPLVANPVRVRLADDNPQLFRAGLNYTLKVCVSLWYWSELEQTAHWQVDQYVPLFVCPLLVYVLSVNLSLYAWIGHS